MHKVNTIILPAAGLAKRLRPLTNRTPKALVRLNGTPLLSYILREAGASGISEAVVIASLQHRGYFEKYIAAHAKDFSGIKKIHLRIQEQPLGDGHAVLQAAEFFGRGPVAVRFPDDLVVDKVFVMKPLIAWHVHTHAPVLLLERVPWESVSRWGIVDVERASAPISGVPQGKGYRLKSFVEKPAREDAPSNLAAVGGYVLTPEFLSHLKRMGKQLTAEHHDALRLADVFRAMLLRGERAYGYEFSGTRLDCGTIEGFAHAEAFIKKHKEKFFG